MGLNCGVAPSPLPSYLCPCCQGFRYAVVAKRTIENHSFLTGPVAIPVANWDRHDEDDHRHSRAAARRHRQRRAAAQAAPWDGFPLFQWAEMMGTEKRDALASQSVRWVSDALDELGNAQTALRDQNYKKVRISARGHQSSEPHVRLIRRSMRRDAGRDRGRSGGPYI